MKKDRVQDVFLENLEKVPIVVYACERAGISRNSVYRWRKEDWKFKKQMEKALVRGVDTINDITESQVIRLVKEGEWRAIRFWLTHRHTAYIKDKKLSEALEELKVVDDKSIEVKRIQSSAKILKLMQELGIWHVGNHKHLQGQEKLDQIDKDMMEQHEKLKELFALMFGVE